ncbi:hypothetical protein SGQ83_14600 [Flavobacterium sp. Fl-318]|uniref:Uncharacterized protein n=1 Tax=Flavobacterium cupriresistens TaxID=2893885 RepID=A0ABU4RDD9_9FLAO|nr:MULTISPECIES: hypothetical protein [unclassified Flavobacterium]MDX6190589.1 hypothetical protein [Flavobacterium sp. Fl-318]UFH43649.1 hypothetical protein LNP23_05375 [Flavobacterium sp. F-323]
MEKDNLIIQKFRELIKNEFKKTFKINVDNNSYRVALSNDEIPIMKSYKKQIDKFVVYFVDEQYPNEIQPNKIFNIDEDLNGSIKSASINYSGLKDNTFVNIRNELKPIYELQKISNSASEQINVEKRIKLLHAIHEIIKTDNEYDKKEMAVL